MNLRPTSSPQGDAGDALDRLGWAAHLGAAARPDNDLDDPAALVQVVREAGSEMAIFLVGHTGSGVIHLECARRHPDEVAGFWCASPALQGEALPATTRILASARQDSSAPLDGTRQAEKTEISSLMIASSIDRRAAPLRKPQITPQWLLESFAAMLPVSAQASNFPVPLLAPLGSDDRLDTHIATIPSKQVALS